MKKRIILSVLALVSATALVLATAPYRCGFTGKEPPHCTMVGNSYTIHYYKYTRSSVISGGCQHEYLEGDVWVIFHNSSAAQYYRFHTEGGQVQYCYDY